MQDLSKEDKSLLDLANECNKTSSKLRKELSKLNLGDGQKDRRLRAVTRGVQSWWNMKRINELNDQFTKYQRSLQTNLLVDLRKRYSINKIESSEGYRRLDDSM